MVTIMQSLLHGSPDAKKAGDIEIQQHSKLVGRGKYIHEFESMFGLLQIHDQYIDIIHRASGANR